MLVDRPWLRMVAVSTLCDRALNSCLIPGSQVSSFFTLAWVMKEPIAKAVDDSEGRGLGPQTPEYSALIPDSGVVSGCVFRRPSVSSSKLDTRPQPRRHVVSFQRLARLKWGTSRKSLGYLLFLLLSGVRRYN